MIIVINIHLNISDGIVIAEVLSEYLVVQKSDVQLLLSVLAADVDCCYAVARHSGPAEAQLAVPDSA